MVGPLREGVGVKAGTLRKSPFFEGRKKMTTKLEGAGVRAIVAGPLKQ